MRSGSGRRGEQQVTTYDGRKHQHYLKVPSARRWRRKLSFLSSLCLGDEEVKMENVVDGGETV